jgi:hypothetical protein
MAVLLVDGAYFLRRVAHPEGEDAHGQPLPAAPGDPEGPYPGATADQGGGKWTFRLPPETWPVKADDLIDGPDGTLVVVGEPRLFSVPGISVADYVGGQAALRPPKEA